MRTTILSETQTLRELAQGLGLHGLVQNWPPDDSPIMVKDLLQWERDASLSRSLERRTSRAKIGHYKALADFDWNWPKKIDRVAIRELMSTSFVDKGTNVILIGTVGVGKTTLAQNLAYQALQNGYRVLFRKTTDLLGELTAIDNEKELTKRLRYFASPQVLVIDELAYLPCSNRQADLLFELISLRYAKQRSTIVTTNKPFAQWGEAFPNATCVIPLVDRLIHRCEVLTIEGESYRAKQSRQEALERNAQRNKEPPAKGKRSTP